VFPLRDENPHFVTPVVTYGLVAANVLCWLLLQGMGEATALTQSVCHLGLIPADVLGRIAAGTLIPLGNGSCVLGEGGGWMTFVSSMFMHGSWMHLLGNMWFLWIFGNNVEDSMGAARFLVFYVLCGLCAAGLQMAANPDSSIPMVGASGAIGGVMGAYIVLYPKVRVQMILFLGFFFKRFAMPAMLMLGYWFAVKLVGGAMSMNQDGQGGVAFWAHVGGFAAGALLIFLFRDRAMVDRHPFHGWTPRELPRV
jgi:membrane associated rhomboid family serine protease